METVTVAAARDSSFVLSGTTLMIATPLIALLAFAIVVGLKHFLGRSARRT